MQSVWVAPISFIINSLPWLWPFRSWLVKALPARLHFSSLSHMLQPDPIPRRSCKKPRVLPDLFATAVHCIRDTSPLWLCLTLTLPAQLEHHLQVSPTTPPCPQQPPRETLTPTSTVLCASLYPSLFPLLVHLCGTRRSPGWTSSVAASLITLSPVLRVLATWEYSLRFAVWGEWIVL